MTNRISLTIVCSNLHRKYLPLHNTVIPRSFGYKNMYIGSVVLGKKSERSVLSIVKLSREYDPNAVAMQLAGHKFTRVTRVREASQQRTSETSFFPPSPPLGGWRFLPAAELAPLSLNNNNLRLRAFKYACINTRVDDRPSCGWARLARATKITLARAVLGGGGGSWEQCADTSFITCAASTWEQYCDKNSCKFRGYVRKLEEEGTPRAFSNEADSPTDVYSGLPPRSWFMRDGKYEKWEETRRRRRQQLFCKRAEEELPDGITK